MISPVIIIIFVILLILLGILLVYKNCNKSVTFLNNGLHNGLHNGLNNGLHRFIIGGNSNANNNFLVFSDKEMNSYIKKLLENFEWKCDNNSKYIHFSFVEDHKYHGHRYVRDHISHHITPVHHYITPANTHISPPTHHYIPQPMHHHKSSMYHISPPLNYKPQVGQHNISLQPHPYYRHGGDLYFENIHHHDNYAVPHNENLYSLIGEIKILGLEFSDKKKMMHHFEKKIFFQNGIKME